MNYIGNNMKKRKTDIIIITIIILVAIISYFFISAFFKDEGTKVQVFQNNKLVKEFPINKDKTYEIKDKDKINIVTVRSGKVFMKDANCPDKLCVKQGSISSNGESIICLPHKVIVKVTDR